MYDSAVAASPGDPQLHGNYAQFLAKSPTGGNAVPGADRRFSNYCRLSGALLQNGLAGPSGKDSLAVEQFSRALALRPDYVPALTSWV